jgi:hypothetical protein
MPYEKDENEIGSLWAKTSAKGHEFLSGEINGVKVVAFKIRDGGGQRPTWRVLKSTPREGQQG